MHHRYNPSVPPVRPQRAVEGWMVAAVAAGMAIGSVGLVAKHIVVPAFASTAATLDAASNGEAR